MALGADSSEHPPTRALAGSAATCSACFCSAFQPGSATRWHRFGPRMDVGDLTAYGPPVSKGGVFSRLRRLGAAPSIVDKQGIEAIKHRRIEIVRGMESLDEHGERLAGGGHVEADVVICATGYRRGLERLIGHLDVLDGRGVPRTRGADAAASGLRFIGYVPRPGGLGCMAKEAKRGAKAIVGELRKTGATRRPQLRLAG